MKGLKSQDHCISLQLNIDLELGISSYDQMLKTTNLRRHPCPQIGYQAQLLEMSLSGSFFFWEVGTRRLRPVCPTSGVTVTFLAFLPFRTSPLALA